MLEEKIAKDAHKAPSTIGHMPNRPVDHGPESLPHFPDTEADHIIPRQPNAKLKPVSAPRSKANLQALKAALVDSHRAADVALAQTRRGGAPPVMPRMLGTSLRARPPAAAALQALRQLLDQTLAGLSDQGLMECVAFVKELQPQAVTNAAGHDAPPEQCVDTAALDPAAVPPVLSFALQLQSEEDVAALLRGTHKPSPPVPSPGHRLAPVP